MEIKTEVSKIRTRLLSLWQYYFLGLYNRISLHNDLLLAGGLAFSLFICIVPMILIIFSILGHLLENISLQKQIESFILTVIPYPDAAEYVKKILFSRIEEFKSLKNIAGYIGIIGLLIASSGLFTSMRNILNIIFYSEKEVKDFCKKHLGRHEIPKKVYFLDELPKNAAGKILKRDLHNNHQSDHHKS